MSRPHKVIGKLNVPDSVKDVPVSVEAVATYLTKAAQIGWVFEAFAYLRHTEIRFVMRNDYETVFYRNHVIKWNRAGARYEVVGPTAL